MNITYSGLADVLATAEVTVTSGGRQTQLGRTLTVEHDAAANRVVSDVEVRGCLEGAAWRRVRDAVWDTGSMESVIDESLARALGIGPVGGAAMATLDGTSKTSVYMVDLRIAEGMVVRDLRVHARDLSGRREDVIVGMDVISLGRLVVDTLAGATTFEFTMREQAACRALG